MQDACPLTPSRCFGGLVKAYGGAQLTDAYFAMA